MVLCLLQESEDGRMNWASGKTWLVTRVLAWLDKSDTSQIHQAGASVWLTLIWENGVLNYLTFKCSDILLNEPASGHIKRCAAWGLVAQSKGRLIETRLIDLHDVALAFRCLSKPKWLRFLVSFVLCLSGSREAIEWLSRAGGWLLNVRGFSFRSRHVHSKMIVYLCMYIWFGHFAPKSFDAWAKPNGFGFCCLLCCA